VQVQPELALSTSNLLLIVLLGVALITLGLVSMWKESHDGQPLKGIIWFTVATIGSCAVIALLAGYVQKADRWRKCPIGWSDDLRIGMNMKITEVIRPANDDLVKGYVDIVFDNCFMVEEIKIIKGPTGLFVSFPAKKQRDGTHRDIALPANAETRMMIQRAILAEYEKIVGGSGSVPSACSASERLRAVDQLKSDGLINEEEHNTKRKEILGEL
jgi:stage V sporulation protein G